MLPSKYHRAVTTRLEPRKRWLQPNGNTPPNSMSVLGIVADVSSTEETPRPLGNKKPKRITISEVKIARLDLELKIL